MLFGKKKPKTEPQNTLLELTQQMDAAKLMVIRTAMTDEKLHLETAEQAVDYMIAKGALDASEREKFILLASRSDG